MIAFAVRPDPVGDFMRVNAWWVIPLFVAGTFWVGMHFAAWLTGWSELASRYRTDAAFEGQKWRFQSAQMRYMSHYNGCLSFGANSQGVYISTWAMFRIAHAPLFVPWSELRVEPKRRWLFPGYELRFGQVPDVFMWIQKSLGDKLQAAAKEPAGYVTAPPIG